MNEKKYSSIRVALCAIALALVGQGQAQEAPSTAPKKVTFIGAARAQFYGDRYRNQTENDTVTPAKQNSGTTLVDLGVKIRPNQQMEIVAMARIRNDYGGFWGAGVSFDVRQLYVKGILGNVVRYQLGDINYRMSKYTLWNYNQEIVSSTPFFLQQQTDVINYDHFYYSDHSWRQQGGAAEMGWKFSKWISDFNIKAVGTRMKTSDFASVSDRLFSGLTGELIQSKSAMIAVNYVNVFDVKGTSRNMSTFHQPLFTTQFEFRKSGRGYHAALVGEMGKSRSFYKELTEAASFDGRFADVAGKVSDAKKFWSAQLSYRYVSSGFRSVGAQTKRVNYGSSLSAFERIGNAQSVRPITMIDLMRETGIYNMQLQTSLMKYLPQYDNITPYGDATPNRQAVMLDVAYSDTTSALNFEAHAYRGKETKGEGTTVLREFNRYEATAHLDVMKWLSVSDQHSKVSVRYRNDYTYRNAGEKIPTVNLRTQIFTVGWDHQWSQKWHFIAGYQWINYKGFEFQNQKDTYDALYNFAALNLNGREQMYSAGFKYEFSKKSFLSIQAYKFKTGQTPQTVANYGFQQFMLLYQINF